MWLRLLGDVDAWIGDLEGGGRCGPCDGAATRADELDEVVARWVRDEDPAAPGGRLEAQVVEELPRAMRTAERLTSALASQRR